MSKLATLGNIPINFEVPKVITTYRIHLINAEEGGFVVTSPDLHALVTQGEDENEALRNAYEAAEIILEAEGLDEEFNLVIDET